MRGAKRAARLFVLPLAAALLIVVTPGAPPGLLASQEAAPAGKIHPRLIDPATTRCETCHRQIVQDRQYPHAPVTEGCTNCHGFETTETGTRVALAEREPALCLMCHDGVQKAAEGSLAAPHAPVTDSCVSCHDPHGSNEAHLLTAAVPALCASCHDFDDLQPKHGGQLTDRTECRSCHVPHGSEIAKMLVGRTQHAPFADRSCDACHRAPMSGRIRLQTRADRLCEACHGEMGKKAPEGGSLHAALASTRGSSGCLSCHSPHLSANTKLLLKPGTALCATCHETVAKGASAEGGHPPAAEDCLGCHQPHDAPQPNLLVEAAPQLCLNCHDATDADLKKAHLSADMEMLPCLQCHTPHGAGTPKLLARHIHAPILDSCDSCHEGSSSKLVENGESALCLACHSEVGEKAQAAKFPHVAVTEGRCTDCHNPHASAQERLVNAPGGGPCVACHSDKAPETGEFGHGVIDWIGCRACHEPHGGDQPRLLRASGSELCLSCHDPKRLVPKENGQAVALGGRFEVPAAQAKAIKVVVLSADGTRGHPTPEHPVTGRPGSQHGVPVEVNFTGELSCFSCHDPHKGRSPKLLKGGAASPGELCLACHPK